MKKLYVFLLPLILLSSIATAGQLFWVGPDNGSFNDAANWSATSGGAGGAGVPGVTTDVVFDRDARVMITAAANQVNAILVTGNKVVKLYSAINTVMTVTSSNASTPGLKIDAGSTLKDSTSADLAFDFVFQSGSLGTVAGNWEFEGNVFPVSGGGAGFTVQPTGVVTVTGTVTFKENTNNIGVDETSAGYQSGVNFNAGSYYILNKDEGASVPDVTYHTNSTILILGNVDFLPGFQGTSPSYGNVVFDLPALAISEGLGFTNTTVIKGRLEFLNTNNQTLRILSNLNGMVSTLNVNHLMISGSTTRVVVADEDNPISGGSAGRFYRLQVKDFTQTGGFLSLQEDPAVTTSTVFSVSGNVNQSAGSFGINSTASSSGSTDLFILEMNGTTAQTIFLEDSIQNKLTLKMNAGSGGNASLLMPVRVARLDLSSGILFTTTTNAANMLTVTDQDPANGVKNGSAASFVNGAFRRATNVAAEYRFPTGKAGVYHTVSVIPTTTAGSVFQAEYFNTGYPDQDVLPPLAGVADNEYWLVERPSGTDNAAVRLTLTARVPRATSDHTIVVAKYNGTAWQSEKGSSGTFVAGDASTGTVTSQPQSTFSPFTFGIEGTAALPIHLLSFEAKKLNGGGSLEWKTEELPVTFEVQRSGDASTYTTVGTVRAIRGTQSYKFFDNNLRTGINYYRIKSVEVNGEVSYSKVVAIVNKENGIDITSIAPNIVTDRTKLSITAARGGRIEIMLTDMSGRTWRKLGFAVSPGSTDTYLNLSDLAAGVYQVTGYMNGEKTRTLRLIKQ